MSVVCEKLKKKLCKLTVKVKSFLMWLDSYVAMLCFHLPMHCWNRWACQAGRCQHPCSQTKKIYIFFPFIYKSNLNYQARIKYYIVYNIISITLKKKLEFFQSISHINMYKLTEWDSKMAASISHTHRTRDRPILYLFLPVNGPYLFQTTFCQL